MRCRKARAPTPSRREQSMMRPFHVLICFLLAAPLPAVARDHFLTIGGGHSASNSQVSLEKNVLFLQDVLSNLRNGDPPHDILFGAGDGGVRDVVFSDKDYDPPKVVRLLAEIYNRDGGLWDQYRPHAIPGVHGAARRESLEAWVASVGAKLADDDRLILYYTGHGGKGNPPRNTTLALWNEPDLTVRELAAMLDRLPPRVSVILIMVQCYAGGFGDLIFQDADPAKGLSPRRRCGFFATTAYRTAAGCTGDIDAENYRDYSTYFWAALSGRTRTGKAVETPDYNHDGKVTLAEAHAYTLINSETVDLPIRASDVFLQQFSKSSGAGRMLDADGPYPRLLDVAGPNERAVLEGLSQALHLSGSDRIRVARTTCSDLQKRRKAILKRKKKLDEDADSLRDSLQDAVESRWPELRNLLDPRAQTIMNDSADEVISAIESSEDYKALHEKLDLSGKADDEATDLERDWVKRQRFIMTAERAAMAANLPEIGGKDLLTRFRELIAAEEGSLTPAK